MRFENLVELQKIFEGTFEPVPSDKTGLTQIKISFIPKDISLFKPHIPPKVYNDLIKYLIDANVTPLTWWPFKLVKATLNYWERLSQGNIRFDLFYRRLTPSVAGSYMQLILQQRNTRILQHRCFKNLMPRLILLKLV